MSRIDNDMQAIRAYLAKQDSPLGFDYNLARRCFAAWQKRGYTVDEAATAIRWIRTFRGSRDYRPKRVDDAVGEAVRHEAAGQYQFKVKTGSPCSKCRYLDLDPSPNCDRLLIWVANPSNSTCPEFKERSL